jgi:hypothetical protein
VTTHPGFGKVKPQRKPSKSATTRSTASQQYDKLKTEGSPEFNIYIRIKDKKNWFPVGSLAVNRSNKINQAIFENEAALLQGGLRLFPILKKHKSQLEYGYRLKEFNDEPIQLAVKPTETSNLIQNTIAQLQTRVTSLFKRG